MQKKQISAKTTELVIKMQEEPLPRDLAILAPVFTNGSSTDLQMNSEEI